MSIAQKTKSYIIARPAIHECLRRGVINYSALAREIRSFYRLKDLPPIVAAATRYANRLKKIGSADRRIDQALKNSEVQMVSDIIHFSLSLPLTKHMLDGLSSLQNENVCRSIVGNQRGIVTCQRKYQATVRKVIGRRILREQSQLIEVYLSQSLDVMHLPGVGARLFGLFGESGIVIYDSLMISGEHLLYCHMKDLPRVHDLIHEGYLGRTTRDEIRS